MKDIEVRLTKSGRTLQGSAIDLGDWDVAIGLEKSFYFYNPNPHAKAVLSGIKNADSRVRLEMPDEVMPQDTVRIGVSVLPQEFHSEAEEMRFFEDVLDTLKGQITWKKP